MSSTAITAIDAGLDYFFQYQRKGKRRKLVRVFRRSTLARCIEWATGTSYTVDEVSGMLQQYRSAQETIETRYFIAARGYARSAQWHVHAGPSLNALIGEGMTMAHAEWCARDAANRVTSDYLREIIPAAKQHPAVEPRVVTTRRKIERALKDLVADVRQDKELWEQANSRLVEVLAKLTPAEEQLLAELDGPNGDQP